MAIDTTSTAQFLGQGFDAGAALMGDILERRRRQALDQYAMQQAAADRERQAALDQFNQAQAAAELGLRYREADRRDAEWRQQQEERRRQLEGQANLAKTFSQGLPFEYGKGMGYDPDAVGPVPDGPTPEQDYRANLNTVLSGLAPAEQQAFVNQLSQQAALARQTKQGAMAQQIIDRYGGNASVVADPEVRNTIELLKLEAQVNPTNAVSGLLSLGTTINQRAKEQRERSALSQHLSNGDPQQQALFDVMPVEDLRNMATLRMREAERTRTVPQRAQDLATARGISLDQAAAIIRARDAGTVQPVEAMPTRTPTSDGETKALLAEYEDATKQFEAAQKAVSPTLFGTERDRVMKAVDDAAAKREAALKAYTDHLRKTGGAMGEAATTPTTPTPPAADQPGRPTPTEPPAPQGTPVVNGMTFDEIAQQLGQANPDATEQDMMDAIEAAAAEELVKKNPGATDDELEKLLAQRLRGIRKQLEAMAAASSRK